MEHARKLGAESDARTRTFECRKRKRHGPGGRPRGLTLLSAHWTLHGAADNERTCSRSARGEEGYRDALGTVALRFNNDDFSAGLDAAEWS